MLMGNGFDEPAAYQIRLKGSLDSTWSDWFDGFSISQQNGETLLEGSVSDQAALHGILAKVNELRLTIIEVCRVSKEVH
jgi:hypothetical protein